MCLTTIYRPLSAYLNYPLSFWAVNMMAPSYDLVIFSLKFIMAVAATIHPTAPDIFQTIHTYFRDRREEYNEHVSL